MQLDEVSPFISQKLETITQPASWLFGEFHRAKERYKELKEILVDVDRKGS